MTPEQRPESGGSISPQKKPDDINIKLGDQEESFSKEEIFEFLKKAYRSSLYSDYFEIELQKAGLLKGLEQAGILPNVWNPNPFDPEEEAAEHAQWWGQHPTEGEKFRQDSDNREQAVRYLFIGAALGHIFEELFPGN